MNQPSALASLTATYTDSEGEEDDNDESQNEGSVTVKSPGGSVSDNKSNSSSRPSSPATVKVTTKVAKLVSYHDDTIVSDEEGDGDDDAVPHQVIMLTDDKENQDEPVLSEEDNSLIPPEPPGHCSIELQEKIARLHEKMLTQSLDMNAVIQKRKDFRNPSIYEKLIQFCELNELGSNYPIAIYDPLKWSKESYYEELALVQKAEMDKREKERKSKVEFFSGTKKHEEEKKRKSKWDQPSGGGLQATQNIKPVGLVQPSTVIPAFGSLQKKPRL